MEMIDVLCQKVFDNICSIIKQSSSQLGWLWEQVFNGHLAIDLSIVFFPLVGFFIVCFFGRNLGRLGTKSVLCFTMVSVVLMSGIEFYKICMGGAFTYITLGPWVQFGAFLINWGFIFDALSLSMLFMVSIVSLFVHIYSFGYMLEDPHFVRFMSYLSLFTFFMFILVSADNFIQLFLGWEGVGLCSYLLISFWFTRVQANKAALKALLMNRIGDFGFLVGVLLLYYFFRSVDFSTVFVLAPYFTDVVCSFMQKDVFCLDVICFFLFFGATGKSAQLGLHTWLPDAMEGPTPVSALIHAATMVTAGIFLIIRCSPIFEFAPTSLLIVTVIGVSTAFFAATVGLVQYDIKRVVAFSTSSQLGYMVFVCGFSAYDASMFHLINHAFFKALLFLSAGGVIHAVFGEQDMRKFGALAKVLPFVYSTLLIGSLALCGVPYLSGFYSKDLILEIAFCKFSTVGFFAYWLGSLAASLTAFYSTRLLFLTFYGETRMFKKVGQFKHDLPLSMWIPLFFLGFGSIFVGFILKDGFVGSGTDFWGNAIFIANKQSHGFDIECMPYLIKNIPTIFSCCGMLTALALYKKFIKQTSSTMKRSVFIMTIIKFLGNKWYFDLVYNYFIGYPIVKLAKDLCYQIIDKGVIEILGPTGISNVLYRITPTVTKFQSGYIHQYICVMVFYLVLFIVSLLLLKF